MFGFGFRGKGRKGPGGRQIKRTKVRPSNGGGKAFKAKPVKMIGVKSGTFGFQ